MGMRLPVMWVALPVMVVRLLVVRVGLPLKGLGLLVMREFTQNSVQSRNFQVNCN